LQMNQEINFFSFIHIYIFVNYKSQFVNSIFFGENGLLLRRGAWSRYPLIWACQTRADT